MLELILPKRFDNDYRGPRVAIWLFGLLLALKGHERGLGAPISS